MTGKNTIQLSLEKSRMVRGHELKRLKLGAFLKAIDEIDMLASGIIAAWIRSEGGIPALSVETLQLACKLMDIDPTEISGDPQERIIGIYEMLNEWIDLNGVDQFWKGNTRTTHDGDKLPPTEFWVQRLIMQAQSIGIGKQDLMEHYYFDEINVLLDMWNRLHSADYEWEEEVSPQAFLSM